MRRISLVRMRRTIPLLAAFACLALLAPSAGGSPGSRMTPPRAFRLTTLAGVGTVYWRGCGKNEHSLGFRVSSMGTTTGITFRAGHRAERRTVQPGYSTIWSPFKDRKQSLSTVSGGEAETIYTRVVVLFNEAHSLPNCFSYAPPRVTVTLNGRDHFA